MDTRAVLNGRLGDANFTDPDLRREERARIIGYWPQDLLDPIREGRVLAPPWRLLLDPISWKDVPPGKVHEFVRSWLGAGRWPSLDGTRKKFGRVSNHRGADEVPGQDSLL